MKRSNDEIFLEETKRKEIKLSTTCQVIITLDESIGSRLLYRKFKYQTSELQLFLQNVPILYWYPLEIIGTPNYDVIDACVLSAALRNTFHDSNHRYYSNMDMVESILDFDYVNGDDENMEPSIKKVAKLMKRLLSDELFILLALGEYQQGGNYLNPLVFISDQLKDDEKFMLKAMKISSDSIEHASDRLKKERFHQSFSNQEDSNSSSEEGTEMHEEEDKVPDLIGDYEKASKILEGMKSGRLNDEIIVLEAVKRNGYSLGYASERLKDNEMFVLEAVKQNANSLICASDRLKDDELIVLEAVKRNGSSLRYASDRLKDNAMIVLEAAKQHSDALKYSTVRLRDDENIVLEAVKHNGNALLHASDRLKDNEKIVLEALKQNPKSLKCASDRLKDDEQFILQVVENNVDALKYVSDRFNDNEKIILQAVKLNCNALKYASDRLKNDFNFANEIFKCCNNLNVFEHFGEELRNIEFIYYFIENYQSRFHELIRKNTKKTMSTTISSLFILGTTFM